MKKIAGLFASIVFVVIFTTACGSNSSLKGYWALVEKKNFDDQVTKYDDPYSEYLEITDDKIITINAASGIAYAKTEQYYLVKKDQLYYADKKIKDSKDLDKEIKENSYAGKKKFEKTKDKLVTTETYEDGTSIVLTYKKIEKEKMPQE